MLVSDLVKMVQAGLTPDIEIVKTTVDEMDYESGMRTTVVSAEVDEDDVVTLQTDFSKFEDYNKNLSSPIWYKRTGETLELVKWHESVFYPKNKRSAIYLMNYDTQRVELLDNRRASLFMYYTESKFDGTYFQWLEKEVIAILPSD